MELEVSYDLENEHQFWAELDDIISASYKTHEEIDNTLRNYIAFTTNYKDEYLQSDFEIAKCTFKLLGSSLFQENKDYVRYQIVYGLLQEDEPPMLHMIAAFLLYDGKQNESTFETLNDEGGFPRVLELLQSMQEHGALLRNLLELFYEMARIQKIRDRDLMLVEDEFIIFLLSLIEGVSDDASDPYHYPVIRVLLVLNEQYMLSTHSRPTQALPTPSPSLPNRILTTLSQHGPIFRTFGANIILLLNRESETSPQLLILKLLYLLFTTPSTYEYFYTNDLRVLVDVMIRNLLDLPYSATALRHTYLRVLYPLLAHTQLSEKENWYKREELKKVLSLMEGGGGAHFGERDDTTRRLGARCAQVAWLRDDDEDGEGKNGNGNLLGIGLNMKAAESSLSVVEVTGMKAKPGEKTPSLGLTGRQDTVGEGEGAAMPEENGGGVDITQSPFVAEEEKA